MKHLTTIYEKDVVAGSKPILTDDFKTREAVRAVLLDDSGEVYLINVTLHGYHKLPGGGIDKNEDMHQALSRELMEEVGCQADIISELGIIIEWNDFEKFKQTSYCFLTRKIGEQSEATFEEDEKVKGMEGVKVQNLQAAVQLLEQDEPNNIEGKFIQKRDLAFLRAAQNYFSSNKV